MFSYFALSKLIFFLSCIPRSLKLHDLINIIKEVSKRKKKKINNNSPLNFFLELKGEFVKEKYFTNFSVSSFFFSLPFYILHFHHQLPFLFELSPTKNI